MLGCNLNGAACISCDCLPAIFHTSQLIPRSPNCHSNHGINTYTTATHSNNEPVIDLAAGLSSRKYALIHADTR